MRCPKGIVRFNVMATLFWSLFSSLCVIAATQNKDSNIFCRNVRKSSSSSEEENINIKTLDQLEDDWIGTRKLFFIESSGITLIITREQYMYGGSRLAGQPVHAESKNVKNYNKLRLGSLR
jgi:hypothetical protein